MLVDIDKEQWWPVFEISGHKEWKENPINIPDDLYGRYRDAITQFESVQQELISILVKLDRYNTL